MSAQRVTGNDLSNPAVGWLAGVTFAAFGLTLLTYSLVQISAGVDAASWVESEATLDRVEISKRHKGGVRIRSLSYQYEFEGKQYMSDRGGLFSLFGNRIHEKAYVLRRKKKRGETVPCYVDPDRPENALLDRSLSPAGPAGMAAFSSVFVVMGVGTLLMMASVGPREKKALEASRQRPDEPWSWLPEWRDREIREEVSNGLAFLAALSLVGITGFGAGAVVANFADARGAAVAPYGVGLALSVLACSTAIVFWLRLAYGERSILRIEGNPVHRGDSLRGDIHLAKKAFAEEEPLAVTLRCVQANWTLTGYYVVKEHWKAVHMIKPSRHDGGAKLPVEFAIPEETPEFDRSEDIDTLWWLEVHRQGMMHGRRVRFVVPVF